MKSTRNPFRSAFTLIEMMAVVLLIMILVGIVGLNFMNSRDGVKLRKDASHCLAFMRQMWDFTKTSNSPLVLLNDPEKGQLSFVDPRTGFLEHLHFSSKAVVVGVLVNDRFHELTSGLPEPEATEGTPAPALDESGPVYISEGRGLTQLGMILAIPEDEGYKTAILIKLNLITGRGRQEPIDPLKLLDLMGAEGQASL